MYFSTSDKERKRAAKDYFGLWKWELNIQYTNKDPWIGKLQTSRLTWGVVEIYWIRIEQINSVHVSTLMNELGLCGIAPVAIMLAKLWCSLSEKTKPAMRQLLSDNRNCGYVDQILLTAGCSLDGSSPSPWLLDQREISWFRVYIILLVYTPVCCVWYCVVYSFTYCCERHHLQEPNSFEIVLWWWKKLKNRRRMLLRARLILLCEELLTPGLYFFI